MRGNSQSIYSLSLLLACHLQMQRVCCVSHAMCSHSQVNFACCCRYAYCPNLTIIDTPGFILKVT